MTGTQTIEAQELATVHGRRRSPARTVAGRREGPEFIR
jgi:hypothetical protein